MDTAAPARRSRLTRAVLGLAAALTWAAPLPAQQPADGEAFTGRSYVVLADQLDPRALASELASLGPRERRPALTARLKAHASSSQADLRAWLAGRSDVTVHDVLWMGNALVLSAGEETLAALARQPGVAAVRPERAMTPAQVQDAGVAGALAPYPLVDDFESGALGPHWTVTTTGEGYASVTGDFDPVDSFHLVMGTTEDLVDSTASITAVFDLTGASDVGVRFQHKEFGDDDHPEDGVFVSDDGLTFHKVIDLQGASNAWTSYWVRLDDVIGPLGLAFNDSFHVRFQWRDNFDVPTDGRAFDEIEIGPGVGVEPEPVPEPHLVALGATQLWEQGFDGAGVLLGTIDSGTWRTHPDLVDRLWANPGEIPGNGVDDDANGYTDDVWGWDFENDDADPQSTDPHGTRSAGLMVGDGSSGRITGVAPGATLVTCQVETEVDYWLAQQYLLDVGVDVISSSYSYKWPDQPDYHMFRQLCDLELAAGIVHANSTGNQGGQEATHPVPFNVSTPGNVPSPFAHPAAAPGGRSSVIGVGGLNVGSNTIYAPSGKGPSAWEDLDLYDGPWPFSQDSAYWDYPVGGFSGSGEGLIKPDILGFTNTVLSTTIPPQPGIWYADFSGTSAATPQIGGALTVLRQVQPQAEPRHLAAALELTALDLGETGKDNRHGAGLPRLWQAARRLVVLARAVPEVVPIGSQLQIQLHGQPDTPIVGFLSAGLITGAGHWNLAFPYFTLPLIQLDGAGEAALDFLIPNDPTLVGFSVWTQWGQPLATSEWGLGFFLSVPEAITFGG